MRTGPELIPGRGFDDVWPASGGKYPDSGNRRRPLAVGSLRFAANSAGFRKDRRILPDFMIVWVTCFLLGECRWGSDSW